MTDEKIVEVLDRYERYLTDNPFPPNGEHLRSMIPKMRTFLAEGRREKLMRWLGFMQGVLWADKEFTLEELKGHNKPDVQERLDALYERLSQDAKERGSRYGQVWHEADIDGHHLYIADTSFGDGPVFRFDLHGWQSPIDEWLPFTRETDETTLSTALDYAERAEWVYRLKVLDPTERSE